MKLTKFPATASEEMQAYYYIRMCVHEVVETSSQKTGKTEQLRKTPLSCQNKTEVIQIIYRYIMSQFYNREEGFALVITNHLYARNNPRDPGS
jgi:hypothetical protein